MKKVLIVDDEKSFLLSLQDGFRQHDNKFTVLTAENGREAVELLKKTAVDLLITDLEMPEMDGFELLAWVSRKLPQLPVSVMTAFGTPEIETRLAEFKTLQYLEKPLDLETFEKAILTGLNSTTKSYIHGITPATFLQLIHLEKKSCTLKVSCKGETGYLYLSQGDLVDAECGDEKGEAAAYRIICWENAEIEMDTLGQRHEGPISSSLESILLNAFRAEDEREQEDEQKTNVLDQEFVLPELGNLVPPDTEEPPRAPAMLSEATLDSLVELLNANKIISEFGFFDQNSSLVRQNGGNCSLHVFDPAIYLHLIGPLDETLDIGTCLWISFFTARRIPFLLFKLSGYSLLVKLQQGARAQVAATKLSASFDSLITTGSKNTLDISMPQQNGVKK